MINIGNKASNLNILIKNKINVPDFIVLNKYNENKINDFVKKTNSKLFAIRSSTNLEDNLNNSWAGLFNSYLNIEKKEIKKYFNKVKESIKNNEVIKYKEKNNIKKEITISVIIQKMIEPDFSGVAFSINPLNGLADEILINLTKGLGNKLVDGKISPDEILLDKNTDNIKIKNTSLEISKEKINKLKNEILKIEKIFKHPVDIEWVFDKNGKLYILQSRPITTNKNFQIIDNSNIAESYSGYTSPLSFSFAKEAYKEVYKSFALLMGMSKKNIKKNEDVFKNMIVYLHGHFYYNLLNWYKMISFFPAYNLSSEFMEKMMGVSESLKEKEIIEKEKIKLKNVFITFWKSLKIIFIFSFMGLYIKKFNYFFDKYYEKEKNTKLDSFDIKKLEKRYRKLEKDLIQKWSIPIANDFAVMTSVGLFEKLYKKWIKKNDFYNFIKTNDLNLISTKHTKKLNEIMILAQENPNIFKKNLNNEEILKKIKESNSILSKKFFEYIETFSIRQPNELKLETIPEKNNPEKIIEIIKNNVEYIKSQKKTQNLSFKISFLKRNILNFLRKWAINSIIRREESRFRRNQAFNLIRNIFIQAGNVLEKEKKIKNWKNIFYLEVNEIFYPTKNINFKKIIEKRKKEEIKNKKIKLKKRYEFYGNFQNLEKHILKENKLKITENIKNNQLKGKVTSFGKKNIIKGNVIVMKSFNPKINIKNKILVTNHTDPGWTVIFPFLKGIVIENGGTLSHASIVAREYEIPCIVGVKNATKILKDNQKIEMELELEKITIK